MRLFSDVLTDTIFSGTYLARDGSLLRIFLTPDEKFRVKASLEKFPPEFIEAVLLQEDRYFYKHAGVNPVALIKAGWETYIKKDRRMGASTITMQLARLKYGIHTKTILGKLNQIAHAIYLELCFPKHDILEAYLNLAPCGGNIEGFPVASWYYFNLPIGKLDLSQILMLAVIPQNPDIRAPNLGTIPVELIDARARLFTAWTESHLEDVGRLTEINLGIKVACRFPFEAPHITEYLEELRSGSELKAITNSDESSIWHTTIDLKSQHLCEETLSRYIEQNSSFGVSNGAVMLIDWTTMEVLASIGSANYFDDSIQGQVNGIVAKRSPGSTLKPFIYALAIEQGLIHPETMLKDTPVSFNEYTPDNFGSDFAGPIHAGLALVDSRNIPSVALARDIKHPDLYGFLSNAGITGLKSREHYGLSIVLGSAEVSMMELVQMYSILANGGTMKNLVMITDQPGEYPATSDIRQSIGINCLTPASAFITRKMLEKNIPPLDVRPGTSSGVHVAFKTGTSIGFKDCWCIAIFDRYILCVWIGNFNGQGNNAFLGRTMATPLLFKIVDSLLARIPESARYPEPQSPDSVTMIPVCSVSGGIPNPNCPATEVTWFIPGVSPITSCHIHRRINIDTQTGYRTDEPIGKHVISEVREFWPTDLLELFTNAGLPRLVPPPYSPDEVRYDNRHEGFPPSIISPLSNVNYILRIDDDKRKSLVLVANSDSDTQQLFWFADHSFLGQGTPGEKLLWNPGTGKHTLTVVDSRGRSSSIALSVSNSE